MVVHSAGDVPLFCCNDSSLSLLPLVRCYNALLISLCSLFAAGDDAGDLSHSTLILDQTSGRAREISSQDPKVKGLFSEPEVWPATAQHSSRPRHCYCSCACDDGSSPAATARTLQLHSDCSPLTQITVLHLCAKSHLFKAHCTCNRHTRLLIADRRAGGQRTVTRANCSRQA
jgi:hypothetical protein